MKLKYSKGKRRLWAKRITVLVVCLAVVSSSFGITALGQMMESQPGPLPEVSEPAEDVTEAGMEEGASPTSEPQPSSSSAPQATEDPEPDAGGSAPEEVGMEESAIPSDEPQPSSSAPQETGGREPDTGNSAPETATGEQPDANTAASPGPSEEAPPEASGGIPAEPQASADPEPSEAQDGTDAAEQPVVATHTVTFALGENMTFINIPESGSAPPTEETGSPDALSYRDGVATVRVPEGSVLTLAQVPAVAMAEGYEDHLHVGWQRQNAPEVFSAEQLLTLTITQDESLTAVSEKIVEDICTCGAGDQSKLHDASCEMLRLPENEAIYKAKALDVTPQQAEPDMPPEVAEAVGQKMETQEALSSGELLPEAAFGEPMAAMSVADVDLIDETLQVGAIFVSPSANGDGRAYSWHNNFAEAIQKLATNGTGADYTFTFCVPVYSLTNDEADMTNDGLTATKVKSLTFTSSWEDPAGADTLWNRDPATWGPATRLGIAGAPADAGSVTLPATTKLGAPTTFRNINLFSAVSTGNVFAIGNRLTMGEGVYTQNGSNLLYLHGAQPGLLGAATNTIDTYVEVFSGAYRGVTGSGPISPNSQMLGNSEVFIYGGDYQSSTVSAVDAFRHYGDASLTVMPLEGLQFPVNESAGNNGSFYGSRCGSTLFDYNGGDVVNVTVDTTRFGSALHFGDITGGGNMARLKIANVVINAPGCTFNSVTGSTGEAINNIAPVSVTIQNAKSVMDFKGTARENLTSRSGQKNHVINIENDLSVGTLNYFTDLNIADGATLTCTDFIRYIKTYDAPLTSVTTANYATEDTAVGVVRLGDGAAIKINSEKLYTENIFGVLVSENNNGKLNVYSRGGSAAADSGLTLRGVAVGTTLLGVSDTTGALNQVNGGALIHHVTQANRAKTPAASLAAAPPLTVSRPATSGMNMVTYVKDPSATGASIHAYAVSSDIPFMSFNTVKEAIDLAKIYGRIFSPHYKLRFGRDYSFSTADIESLNTLTSAHMDALIFTGWEGDTGMAHGGQANPAFEYSGFDGGSGAGAEAPEGAVRVTFPAGAKFNMRIPVTLRNMYTTTEGASADNFKVFMNGAAGQFGPGLSNQKPWEVYGGHDGIALAPIGANLTVYSGTYASVTGTTHDISGNVGLRLFGGNIDKANAAVKSDVGGNITIEVLSTARFEMEINQLIGLNDQGAAAPSQFTGASLITIRAADGVQSRIGHVSAAYLADNIPSAYTFMNGNSVIEIDARDIRIASVRAFETNPSGSGYANIQAFRSTVDVQRLKTIQTIYAGLSSAAHTITNAKIAIANFDSDTTVTNELSRFTRVNVNSGAKLTLGPTNHNLYAHGPTGHGTLNIALSGTVVDHGITEAGSHRQTSGIFNLMGGGTYLARAGNPLTVRGDFTGTYKMKLGISGASTAADGQALLRFSTAANAQVSDYVKDTETIGRFLLAKEGANIVLDAMPVNVLPSPNGTDPNQFYNTLEEAVAAIEAGTEQATYAVNFVAAYTITAADAAALEDLTKPNLKTLKLSSVQQMDPAVLQEGPDPVIPVTVAAGADLVMPVKMKSPQLALVQISSMNLGFADTAEGRQNIFANGTTLRLGEDVGEGQPGFVHMRRPYPVVYSGGKTANMITAHVEINSGSYAAVYAGGLNWEVALGTVDLNRFARVGTAYMGGVNNTTMQGNINIAGDAVVLGIYGENSDNAMIHTGSDQTVVEVVDYNSLFVEDSDLTLTSFARLPEHLEEFALELPASVLAQIQGKPARLDPGTRTDTFIETIGDVTLDLDDVNGMYETHTLHHDVGARLLIAKDGTDGATAPLVVTGNNDTAALLAVDVKDATQRRMGDRLIHFTQAANAAPAQYESVTHQIVKEAEGASGYIVYGPAKTVNVLPSPVDRSVANKLYATLADAVAAIENGVALPAGGGAAEKTYAINFAEAYTITATDAAALEAMNKPNLHTLKFSSIQQSDYAVLQEDPDPVIPVTVDTGVELVMPPTLSSAQYFEVRMESMDLGFEDTADGMQNIFANGTHLFLGGLIEGEMRTRQPFPTVFGGARNGDVEETLVEIKSGSYAVVYAGGRDGDVSGMGRVMLDQDARVGLAYAGGVNGTIIWGGTIETAGNAAVLGIYGGSAPLASIRVCDPLTVVEVVEYDGFILLGHLTMKSFDRLPEPMKTFALSLPAPILAQIQGKPARLDIGTRALGQLNLQDAAVLDLDDINGSYKTYGLDAAAGTRLYIAKDFDEAAPLSGATAPLQITGAHTGSVLTVDVKNEAHRRAGDRLIHFTQGANADPAEYASATHIVGKETDGASAYIIYDALTTPFGKLALVGQTAPQAGMTGVQKTLYFDMYNYNTANPAQDGRPVDHAYVLAKEQYDQFMVIKQAYDEAVEGGVTPAQTPWQQYTGWISGTELTGLSGSAFETEANVPTGGNNYTHYYGKAVMEIDPAKQYYLVVFARLGEVGEGSSGFPIDVEAPVITSNSGNTELYPAATENADGSQRIEIALNDIQVQTAAYTPSGVLRAGWSAGPDPLFAGGVVAPGTMVGPNNTQHNPNGDWATVPGLTQGTISGNTCALEIPDGVAKANDSIFVYIQDQLGNTRVVAIQPQWDMAGFPHGRVATITHESGVEGGGANFDKTIAFELWSTDKECGAADESGGVDKDTIVRGYISASATPNAAWLTGEAGAQLAADDIEFQDITKAPDQKELGGATRDYWTASAVYSAAVGAQLYAHIGSGGGEYHTLAIDAQAPIASTLPRTYAKEDGKRELTFTITEASATMDGHTETALSVVRKVGWSVTPNNAAALAGFAGLNDYVEVSAGTTVYSYKLTMTQEQYEAAGGDDATIYIYAGDGWGNISRQSVAVGEWIVENTISVRVPTVIGLLAARAPSPDVPTEPVILSPGCYIVNESTMPVKTFLTGVVPSVAENADGTADKQISFVGKMDSASDYAANEMFLEIFYMAQNAPARSADISAIDKLELGVMGPGSGMGAVNPHGIAFTFDGEYDPYKIPKLKTLPSDTNESNIFSSPAYRFNSTHMLRYRFELLSGD